MRYFIIGMVVVVLCGVTQVTEAVTYNARQDFSETENPNGVWSYGYCYSLGGSMIVYPDYLPDYSGESTWRDDNLNDTHDIPNASEREVTFWGFVLGPNDLIIHPGPDGEYSMIRWTAPADGTINLDAGFAGAHGNDTVVFLYHNATKLFEEVLPGYAVATPYNNQFEVLQGDNIDFAVGVVSDASGTSTACSAIIEFNPVPEPSSIILLLWELLCFYSIGGNKTQANLLYGIMKGRYDETVNDWVGGGCCVAGVSE